MNNSICEDIIKCRCCNKELNISKSKYGSYNDEDDDFTCLNWFYCNKCKSFFATMEEDKCIISISYSEASVDFFNDKKNEKLKNLRKKLLSYILFDIESEINITEIDRYSRGENLFNEDEWSIEDYIGKYKCRFDVKFDRYDNATVEVLSII